MSDEQDTPPNIEDTESGSEGPQQPFRRPKEPRQTATYLSKRLTAAGLRPVSRYGQNFLIDLNLIDLIARSAKLQRNDVVLEIGTGVGSLTRRLSDSGGAVLSVEIDQNLASTGQRRIGESAKREIDPWRRSQKQEHTAP